MTAFDWEKARKRDLVERRGGTPVGKGKGKRLWAQKPASLKGPSGGQQKSLAHWCRVTGEKYEHPATAQIAQRRIQALKRKAGASARADRKVRRDRASYRWNNLGKGGGKQA